MPRRHRGHSLIVQNRSGKATSTDTIGMAGASSKQLRDNLANYEAQLDQVRRGYISSTLYKGPEEFFLSCSRHSIRIEHKNNKLAAV